VARTTGLLQSYFVSLRISAIVKFIFFSQAVHLADFIEFEITEANRNSNELDQLFEPKAHQPYAFG